jgi:transposase-like protein
MAKHARKRDGERAAFWRSAILRQEASGQSIRAFCLAEGIKESAYYHWRRELARRDVESPTRNPDAGDATTVVPAQLVDATTVVPVRLLDDRNNVALVEIVAGNGYVIRVGETATTDHVRRVLRAVGEPD